MHMKKNPFFCKGKGIFLQKSSVLSPLCKKSLFPCICTARRDCTFEGVPYTALPSLPITQNRETARCRLYRNPMGSASRSAIGSLWSIPLR